ncbi:hypothetical protein [Romboutsia hominis]|uniref:Uncharacterized protein n=1 Tax=Romboutsia hominis TaxID=1507512 RepID=A0A2P2BQJ3_9FIRM|nr:hypothetical protein [Romboutsia hominis]CEI72608.1 Hypothetical protein FRIFI_1068 [Romboutsia hominis]
MLDVVNIDEVYNLLNKKSIEITKPEHLKFKCFFNMLTRTMPWQNSYINFFEGVPLQIGFQQMNNEKSRKFMNEYMIPNSRDNDIIGISEVIVRGPLTNNDIKLIHNIFDIYITQTEPLTIQLNQQHVLVFEDSESYSVDIITKCNNKSFNNKSISIENIAIKNI